VGLGVSLRGAKTVKIPRIFLVLVSVRG
jgi:hypothetical protein